MPKQHNLESQVALFIQQFDQEMEAMQRGLNGFALTARHDFVHKRMEQAIDEKKLDELWNATRQKSPSDIIK